MVIHFYIGCQKMYFTDSRLNDRIKERGQGLGPWEKEVMGIFSHSFSISSPALAILRLPFLVSVAKGGGQGLQIHHNYSNLSPPCHKATPACLPHICLEAALLHNHLRFNYRAMIATSSNRDWEKAPVNLHAFRFCFFYAPLLLSKLLQYPGGELLWIKRD